MTLEIPGRHRRPCAIPECPVCAADAAARAERIRREAELVDGEIEPSAFTVPYVGAPVFAESHPHIHAIRPLVHFEHGEHIGNGLYALPCGARFTRRVVVSEHLDDVTCAACRAARSEVRS